LLVCLLTSGAPIVRRTQSSLIEGGLPVCDGQGFGKPLGYKGKGKEGKGQGTDFETLDKLLPFWRGQGSFRGLRGF